MKKEFQKALLTILKPHEIIVKNVRTVHYKGYELGEKESYYYHLNGLKSKFDQDIKLVSDVASLYRLLDDATNLERKLSFYYYRSIKDFNWIATMDFKFKVKLTIKEKEDFEKKQLFEIAGFVEYELDIVENVIKSINQAFKNAVAENRKTGKHMENAKDGRISTPAANIPKVIFYGHLKTLVYFIWRLHFEGKLKFSPTNNEMDVQNFLMNNFQYSKNTNRIPKVSTAGSMRKLMAIFRTESAGSNRMEFPEEQEYISTLNSIKSEIDSLLNKNNGRKPLI